MYKAQKMKFSIKGFFSKCDQIPIPYSDWIWRDTPYVSVLSPNVDADLVTFTEETFNGKLHPLCSGDWVEPRV